jgi:hypothetical protein
MINENDNESGKTATALRLILSSSITLSSPLAAHCPDDCARPWQSCWSRER